MSIDFHFFTDLAWNGPQTRFRRHSGNLGIQTRNSNFANVIKGM